MKVNIIKEKNKLTTLIIKETEEQEYNKFFKAYVRNLSDDNNIIISCGTNTNKKIYLIFENCYLPNSSIITLSIKKPYIIFYNCIVKKQMCKSKYVNCIVKN